MDIIDRAKAAFTNPRTGKWDKDAEVVRDLVAEIESLRLIVGRCDEYSGHSRLTSRCDLPKGHSGSHESSAHGFSVWTNHEDWTPGSERLDADRG